MASPLTVKGLGGLSRDELVSKDSGIPVMGGVACGKKAVISGIPVMGGVTGVRTYADVTKKNCSVGKLIAKRNVERKKRIEGLALREAPHVSHGGLAQVPVIGTSVSPLGRLLCSARSQAKVV